MQETWVRSLGREDPLEKEMATHSGILAWRIPWTEELGRLQSTGSQSWTQLSDFTFTFSHVVGRHFTVWATGHLQVFTEPSTFSFFGISGWGIDLDYCYFEWLALEMNRYQSFCCFWDCTQVLHFRLFCWLWSLPHFFCGILVVAVMVIWIKFAHFNPF